MSWNTFPLRPGFGVRHKNGLSRHRTSPERKGSIALSAPEGESPGLRCEEQRSATSGDLSGARRWGLES